MSNMNSPSPDETSSQFPPGIRIVESDQLLEGDKTILIRHEGDVYRLAVTRNGKLILQK